MHKTASPNKPKPKSPPRNNEPTVKKPPVEEKKAPVKEKKAKAEAEAAEAPPPKKDPAEQKKAEDDAEAKVQAAKEKTKEMEEKAKAAYEKAAKAEAEQAAKTAAAAAKKPVAAAPKAPPKPTDADVMNEAAKKANQDIVNRKNNHAKAMAQFDTLIKNAGKEGASLADATAAWSAYEGMIQEVKNE